MSSFRSLARSVKQALYVASFPLFSLFSARVGFTVFYPSGQGWRAHSRGRSFRVAQPRLEALEYFRHFVPSPGQVVFDVGGELGFETAQFADLVGPVGKVFVFECMPRHVEQLRRLSAAHPQVEVVDRACWNVATELTFFEGETPGSNTAVPDAKGQHGQALAQIDRRFIVQAETLDALWARLHAAKPVSFLKMDIEGAEYEALEGAKQMLAATHKAVIAAYHIRDGVPTAARVEQMLREAGFTTQTDENLHVYAWRTV